LFIEWKASHVDLTATTELWRRNPMNLTAVVHLSQISSTSV